MKLGKISWLILTSGIFIIAFASLGIAHYQQLDEQSLLNEELSMVELRLSKVQLKELSAQREELEKRLNQAISQLEAAKDNLRQSIESIEVTDSLFEIAEACDVEITEISSSATAKDTSERVTCLVLPLTVRAAGDVSKLISFITKLNDDFATGVVKSAQINISANSTEDKPSANIQLVVYTYEGG